RPVVDRQRAPRLVRSRSRRDRQSLGRRCPARRQAVPCHRPLHHGGHSSKGAMMMRKLFVMFVIAGCGPKPATAPLPVSPGDGDPDAAQPPPVKQPAVADPWTGRSDLIASPAARPPTALELPKIDEFKLANGLQVYAVKSDRVPVVAMHLAIRA